MVNTTGDMVQALQKRRRQLVRLFLESALITLASLAVVGTQLFYPFHVVIGVTLYILSYIPFVYRIYLSRDTWRRYHSYGLAKDFIKRTPEDYPGDTFVVGFRCVLVGAPT